MADCRFESDKNGTARILLRYSSGTSRSHLAFAEETSDRPNPVSNYRMIELETGDGIFKSADASCKSATTVLTGNIALRVTR